MSILRQSWKQIIRIQCNTYKYKTVALCLQGYHNPIIDILQQMITYHFQSSFDLSGFWIGMTLYCVDTAKLELCFLDFPSLHSSAMGLSENKSSEVLGARTAAVALLYAGG